MLLILFNFIDCGIYDMIWIAKITVICRTHYILVWDSYRSHSKLASEISTPIDWVGQSDWPCPPSINRPYSPNTCIVIIEYMINYMQSFHFILLMYHWIILLYLTSINILYINWKDDERALLERPSKNAHDLLGFLNEHIFIRVIDALKWNK